MNKPKITQLYFRSVAPLLTFIYLFNESCFLFTFFRNTHTLPLTNLIQSLMVAVTGFILLMIPAFVFSGRIEKLSSAENTIPDDLKLMVFIKSMRGLSLTVWVTAFTVIVAPRLTGLFFSQEEFASSVFVFRTALNVVISLILWGIAVFLMLYFFRTGIGKLPEVSTIKKYSHLRIKKNFSFGFVLLFGLMQVFLITAAYTLSAGAFFAERGIRNPTEADFSMFALTGIASGILVLILMLIFLRVFGNLQHHKVGRTLMMLDEIAQSGDRFTSNMNIVTLDEFGDLYESINLLMENMQTMASEFKAKTNDLHHSIIDTGTIYTETRTPLAEITEASGISAESNSQITILSRTDKNVHNLNNIAKLMEEQILAQEDMVTQTSEAIGQMSSSIVLILQTIQTASQLSDKLKNYSITGNKAIDEAGKAIEEIRDAAGSVSEILSVIQRIASQTNLLSMNASIEAAHAGASGTGFALVAQSVRALADASTKSAKKIENHISEMSEWIQIGTQTIDNIVKTFSEIQKGINENGDLIATIANAMNEEEEAARDTLTAIESVVTSVRSIKTQFQTQKEAAINVEETITLILDLSDRMQQLLISEKEMTAHLNETVESMIKELECSRQTLIAIDKATGHYTS